MGIAQMGYTMRTRTHRFTAWIPWDESAARIVGCNMCQVRAEAGCDNAFCPPGLHWTGAGVGTGAADPLLVPSVYTGKDVSAPTLSSARLQRC